MKTVDNSLRFQTDNVAQFRYRCLQLAESQGVAAVRLAFPGVSERSLRRWRQAYRQSGKQQLSLRPQSTRPKNVRQMVIPVKIFSFLKVMRQQHPQLSKYKLKVFLDEFCRQEGLNTFSVSWIGKVVSRNAFFFKTRKPIKKVRKSGTKQRVLYCPRLKDVGLGYLQVDGIKVIWEGQPLYFLSALEICSRQAWAKRVKTLSSQQAKLFLEEIGTQVNYPIHTIQTDNGSEFGWHFDLALKELRIVHLWSKPHSPKTNGFVERFNGIVQQEFINYHLDLGLSDKKLFDQKLAEWLCYYNCQRPHFGLQLQTPRQRLVQLQETAISV